MGSAYHWDGTSHWLGKNVEKLSTSASSSVLHLIVHHFAHTTLLFIFCPLRLSCSCLKLLEINATASLHASPLQLNIGETDV